MTGAAARFATSCASLLYRLPRLIGAARAKELILLGEPISARAPSTWKAHFEVCLASEEHRQAMAALRSRPRA